MKIELKKEKINHRDYKLDNILLEDINTDVTKDNSIILTDFDTSNEAITLTEATFKRQFT